MKDCPLFMLQNPDYPEKNLLNCREKKLLEALKNAQATLKYHGTTPLIKVEQAISEAENEMV
jgi:hypothetical protein